MSLQTCISFVLCIAILLGMAGCKPEESEASSTDRTAAYADPAPVIEQLTAQMRAIPFEKLSRTRHRGRRCVVLANTPERRDPPPPPLGMVRLMGPSIIYAAEIHALSEDTLEVSAKYPSGNLKIVSIPRSDIKSIHIAD